MSSLASLVFAGTLLCLGLAAGLALAAGHLGAGLDAPDGRLKLHASPRPRLGGLALYASLIVLWQAIGDSEAAKLLASLLLASLPALCVGVLEDLTGRTGVRLRLAATLASGLLATVLAGVCVARVSVPGFDELLAIAPLATLFTCIALAGMANAMNIIDGFHGLASGTAAICAVAIGAIAHRAGDPTLVLLCALLVAVLAGFGAVNFPWGRLFLGDGGAYFAGFMLGCLAVLLPARNPSVSPWASLLVCAYPVTEVAYSVLRRLAQRNPACEGDAAHLHSIIASKVVRRHFRGVHPDLQNASVAVLSWVCAAIPAFAAVTFSGSTSGIALCCGAWVVLYHHLYRRISLL